MFYNIFLDLGQFLGRKSRPGYLTYHCNKSGTFWQKEDKLSQTKEAGYLIKHPAPVDLHKVFSTFQESAPMPRQEIIELGNVGINARSSGECGEREVGSERNHIESWTIGTE